MSRILSFNSGLCNFQATRGHTPHGLQLWGMYPVGCTRARHNSSLGCTPHGCSLSPHGVPTTPAIPTVHRYTACLQPSPHHNTMCLWLSPPLLYCAPMNYSLCYATHSFGCSHASLSTYNPLSPHCTVHLRLSQFPPSLSALHALQLPPYPATLHGPGLPSAPCTSTLPLPMRQEHKAAVGGGRGKSYCSQSDGRSVNPLGAWGLQFNPLQASCSQQATSWTALL